MRGIVVYCPNQECRKPLLRDAYLRIGSRCSLRCFSCGGIIKLEATPNGILRDVEKSRDVPDAKKGAIVGPEKRAEDDSCFMVVET